MFHIDSITDKADIRLLYNTLKEQAKNGIVISGENTDDGLLELKQELQNCQDAFKEKYGINPNSNKDLQGWFSDNMVSDFMQCFTSAGFRLRKQELESLQELGYTIAKDLLFIRQLRAKVCNTIKAGEYRPTLSLSATNRVYYARPNIQKIPIERVLPKDPKTEYLVSVDIHNQEPLIYAEIIGSKKLHDILTREGTDFYVELSNEVLQDRAYEITRQDFKQVWLQCMYGSSLNSIQRMFGEKYDDALLQSIYDYFNDISEAKRYIQHAYAVKQGYKVQETVFGTRLESTQNEKQKTAACINKPIQGTASDIMSIILKHILTELDIRGLSDKIHLYYYRFDEFIFRVSNTISENEVTDLLTELMECQVDDWAKFELDIKIYKNNKYI